jgi:hypothetical protein
METVQGGQEKEAGNVNDGSLCRDQAFHSNTLEILGIFLSRLEGDWHNKPTKVRKTMGQLEVGEGR